MMERTAALHHWLQQQPQITSTVELLALPSDAGFRRYFRLLNTSQSLLAVDAPLQSEKPAAFVALAKILASLGIRTPQIYAADLDHGFLLIEDFGDELLAKHLSSSNSEQLYPQAFQTLQQLQAWRQAEQFDVWQLPHFNAKFIAAELNDVSTWVVQRYLGLSLPTMLADFFQQLTHSATIQPQAAMHRDYHARNLILLPNQQLGVIDFQDMFIGPITYDLVSLLRDCYMVQPKVRARQLAQQFYEQTEYKKTISTEQFLHWFDWMGLQRHLKAALTFARKHLRDQNPHYLADIPTAFRYIAEVAADYPELKLFNRWWQQTALPRLAEVQGASQ